MYKVQDLIVKLFIIDNKLNKFVDEYLFFFLFFLFHSDFIKNILIFVY